MKLKRSFLESIIYFDSIYEQIKFNKLVFQDFSMAKNNYKLRYIKDYSPSKGNALELFNNGNLQEALWEYQDLGDQEEAKKIHLKINDILLTSEYTVEDICVEFLSTKATILFKQGVKGKFKFTRKESKMQMEILAYEIDKYLGIHLIPNIVEREVSFQHRGKSYRLKGNISYLVEVPEAKDLKLSEKDHPLYMRLLDLVIGNRDRNFGNWLVLKNGRIAAIDNDTTFEYVTHPKAKDNEYWQFLIDSFSKEEKTKLTSIIGNFKVMDLTKLPSYKSYKNEHFFIEFQKYRRKILDNWHAIDT